MNIKLLSFCLLFTVALSAYSLDKSAYYDEYTDILSAEDWSRGEKLYAEAVSEFPEELVFHCYLNEMLRGLEKNEEALSQIAPVYEKNTGNSYVFGCYKWSMIEIGLQKRDEKDFEKALDLLKRAYELDKNEVAAALWYGILLRETGDIDSSIDILEIGKKRFNDEYIISNLVYSYVEKANQIRASDPDQAEKLYRKSLVLDDQNVTTVLWLGIFLREQKRYEESIRVLEEGISFSDNEYLFSNLLYAYVDFANEIRAERPETAELLYQNALKIDYTNLTAMLWYGIFLREWKEYAGALELFERAEKLYPDNEHLPSNINHTYFEYGDYLVKNDRREEAIGIYENAVKRFPENLFYYFHLFTNYMELEKLKKAELILYQWCGGKKSSKLSGAELFDEEINIYYRLNDLIMKYVIKKDFKKAFSILDNFEFFFENRHFIINREGELLWLNGEIEAGIRLINQAFDLYTEDHPGNDRPVVIDLPMKGTFVTASGNNSSTAMTHAGLARYCFDFMGSDKNGRTTRENTNGIGKNEDYLGFGMPIFSPVDGVVVSIADDAVDHAPTTEWQYHLEGNQIIIQDSNNYNYVFVHNKYLSASVSLGETVKAGQKIAELGNTASSVPHLHFGVWSENWTVTIPVKFKRYVEITKDGDVIERKNRTPEQGTVIQGHLE
jgi:tetratricopeptide (TPR) repeat protein